MKQESSTAPHAPEELTSLNPSIKYFWLHPTSGKRYRCFEGEPPPDLGDDLDLCKNPDYKDPEPARTTPAPTRVSSTPTRLPAMPAALEKLVQETTRLVVEDAARTAEAAEDDDGFPPPDLSAAALSHPQPHPQPRIGLNASAPAFVPKTKPKDDTLAEAGFQDLPFNVDPKRDDLPPWYEYFLRTGEVPENAANFDEIEELGESELGAVDEYALSGGADYMQEPPAPLNHSLFAPPPQPAGDAAPLPLLAPGDIFASLRQQAPPGQPSSLFSAPPPSSTHPG
ncbi:hypothetical protein PAPYR_3618 [Paratrimastix pyriformis]|uniref:Uncharacterized protein n=1 Tax=Paratrimastix pyriformis TaxID=342808 RepID=A0ABQ8UM24_9EUKA|nr:hypothetical protein PAPYR_3618 [Paratrimastix pyriformis]|eukprot:GAFH01003573.1.p1 GENE.GAFH01003573.1~~GAFH01003573.1.p1  ORF type:complete len:283 (-),score=2.51 GAFH01003573.1:32-880(-)